MSDPIPTTSPPAAKTGSNVGNWILRITIVAALIAALVFLPISEWLQSAIDYIEDLGATGVIVFIVLYIIAAVFFLPGSVLTLGAGAIYGVAWGSVWVSIASTLGASAAFLVGRYLARDKIAHKIEGNPSFTAIDEAVAHQGWKIVGLTRLSPVFPFTLLNYAFGLTKVKFSHYVLASWIGMMPGTIMYVYLGYAARAATEASEAGLAQTALKVGGLIATIVVTVIITHTAKKALDKAVPITQQVDPAE